MMSPLHVFNIVLTFQLLATFVDGADCSGDGELTSCPAHLLLQARRNLLNGQSDIREDDGETPPEEQEKKTMSPFAQETRCGEQPDTSTMVMTEKLTDHCGSCPKSSELGDSVGSCCRKAGQTDWGSSNMFHLFNAIYEDGELWIDGGEPEAPQKMLQCYQECEVTWFEYAGSAGIAEVHTDHVEASLAMTGASPSLATGVSPSKKAKTQSLAIGLSPASGTGLSPSTKGKAKMLDGPGLPSKARHMALNSANRSRLQCEGNWKEVALVVDRYFPNNLYHAVIDALFTSFLTASHLSLELGCSSDAIVPVFYDRADGSSARNNATFDPLWHALFGKPKQLLSQMSGCYRRVVYGYMYKQRFFHWPAKQTHVYRSPVLMPWMMAFFAEPAFSVVAGDLEHQQ